LTDYLINDARNRCAVDRGEFPPADIDILAEVIPMLCVSRAVQRLPTSREFSLALARTPSTSPCRAMRLTRSRPSGMACTRVLNLAEWTTADAHRQAVTEPATRLRRTTRHFLGVTGIAVHRFSPYRGIASPGG
jgi:hypothetical protein